MTAVPAILKGAHKIQATRLGARGRLTSTVAKTVTRAGRTHHVYADHHGRRVIMGVGLVIGLSFLAYTLAIYAVPFMLGITAARFAYATGSGFVGAGLVGIVAGVVVFCGLVFLFMGLRHPLQRLVVALIFAGPAAIAGYELVYGITRDSVPSEIWRQLFCIFGGVFVGLSAMARFIGSPELPMRG